MAVTPSTMLPIGTRAPFFSLSNGINDNIITLDEVIGEKGTLVMFICNHCPYVLHLIEHLVSTCKEIEQKGIKTVAICSNDVDNYPLDSPEKMVEFAKKNQFNFPYLFDAKQTIAKLYEASCTPDFFLFDSGNRLTYRGRYDDSRPGNDIELTGTDLKNAVDNLLNGKPTENQIPSLGCNIKWKE